jgi:hypothetical protein
MHLFLLLQSCLSSFVAVLINLMLFGVRHQCQHLRSLLFSLIFCLINVERSYALSVSVCSVMFQPAHFIVSLKNLTTASILSSVLR